MTSKDEYGTVEPVIYVDEDEDSNEFWRGSPENAPDDYDPVGWIKKGENRLYIDDSAVEITSQNGMPVELQQPDTLTDESTEADLKRELINFIKQVQEDRSGLRITITWLELDQHINSHGYDTTGDYPTGEPGSEVIYWKADQAFMSAVISLVRENWLRLRVNSRWKETRAKYRKQASKFDRSIPVSGLPIAKRLGEYSYKTMHWGLVDFYPGRKAMDD